MTAILAVLVSKLRRSQSLRLAVGGAVCLVGGAAAFSVTQHLGFGLALYWAITTATTVGYGDVVPKNGAGRVVAVAEMLTAIPLFGAAFALFAATVTAAKLSRFLKVEHHFPPGAYVVVLGMHPTVPLVARQLAEAGFGVVLAAEADGVSLPSHVHHVDGPPTDEETVRSTKPAEAEAVLLVSPDDGEMLVSAVLLRHLAPEVTTIAVAQSSMVAAALADLGIQQTISTEDLLGHALAKSLEAPHAADVLLRLVDGEGYRLEEVEVTPDQVGTTLRAARAELDGLLLGLVRDGKVTLGIRENPTLRPADRLVRVAAR